MRICYFYAVLSLLLFAALTAHAQESYDLNPFYEDTAITTADSLPQIDPTNNTRINLQKVTDPRPTEPSRIESYYATRIIEDLTQFGYSVFTSTRPQKTSLFNPMGAVQNDFILNVGDRLNVTLRGQINTQKFYTIDTNGLITLDDLPPVSAAGRSLEQVEVALKHLLEDQPNINLGAVVDVVKVWSII